MGMGNGGTSGARAAAAVVIALASSALSQDARELTLSARAGPLRVTGSLLSYDGDVYAIDTVYGPLTLDAASVTCAGEACPDGPAVAIHGDPALTAVLMPALVEAFADRRGLSLTRETTEGGGAYTIGDGEERLRIDLRRAAPGTGPAAMASGRADAAVSLRDEAGGEMTRVLAFDALVPVVSPSNPVRALGLGQIAALLAGEVTDWAALGGAPGPVTLHLPEFGTGPARAVEDLVMRPAGLALSEAVVRHADPESLARAVAGDPGAVGVATLGTVGLAEPLALRGTCGLVSRAGRDAVRSGDWPLTLPVRLHLPARPLPPLARELLEFAASEEARGVVRRAGLIDQAPEAIALDAQGERLAAAILAAGPEVPLATLQALVGELRGMTRLTPTFRFEGGTRLDAASREAVRRLARAIAQGAHDGRELVFVGFGDATGSAARNLVLSRRRAETVLGAVRDRIGPPREGAPPLSVLAFGETLPAACDDTAAGRRLSRRVELWVREPASGGAHQP